jgi:hypothetical protein
MEDGDFFGKGVIILIFRILMSKFILEDKVLDHLFAMKVAEIHFGMINLYYNLQEILM